MTIRAYTPDDQRDIINLGLLFVFTPYVIDKKFRNFTNVTVPLLVIQQFQNSNIKVYVAVENNRVVGFISYIIEEELSRCVSSKCASILFLVVESSYQRKGVATKLLNFVEEECKKSKIKNLRVGTDEGNGAINLYKKQGYKTVLLWEIHRIYKDELRSPMRTIQLHRQVASDYAVYPWNTVLKRPVPWFYDEELAREDVHRMLISKIRNQLDKNTGMWLTASKEHRSVSVLLSRDSTREKYYGLQGTLWTLNDIFGYEGLCAEFLNTILYTLPNFLMAEYWVCAEDETTKKILKDIGMNKVYGGISLVKKL